MRSILYDCVLCDRILCNIILLLPQDEMDPAYALLFEHVSAADPSVRLHAVMGLALAYAGTQKEEVCLPFKLLST